MLIVPTEKHFDWQHAPYVLFAIVLTNIFVFIFYQSGDFEKISSAIEPFVEKGYVEKEWPIYSNYLQRENRFDELGDVRKFYRQDNQYAVAQYMLFDNAYYTHVQRAARSEFSPEYYQQWKSSRSEIQDGFNSISSYRYGLRATDVSFVTLISHQFLHGGLGHIVGNLIFLVVFGFAVEAAIGHIRFLCFYLIGGMAAGLAQVFTNLGSDVPLVGASGAISGVMAMYLAVFRLRKIEFFYWVFFFVGYFRAPAMLILPFYIGKELISYYTNTGSNVAFMAHAGGFVGGSILIGLALLFDRNVLNKEYIEQDQKISPRTKSLAEIYKAIETLRFDYALKLVKNLINQEGIDFDLAVLQFNLEKIKRGKEFTHSFNALIHQVGLSSMELETLNRLWLETKDARSIVNDEDQLNLAFKFTGLNNLKGAEQILDGLLVKKFKPSELFMLTTKLAKCFADKQDNAKSMKYQEIAQLLSKEGHHGVV